MRYILIVVIIFLTSAGLFGQTTILSEDFNDGFPAGWQLVDNDGLTPNESSAVNFITEPFVLVEDADSTGISDSVLVATSWFDEPGEADNWLILPNLTLGSYGNYISFDARSLDASHPEGLEIRVSTGGVDLWEFFALDTVAYANVSMNPEWTNYTVSLDSLDIADENVFIAFRHYSYDNYILALDNIKVFVNDPVSVEESSSSYAVYPNPSVNGMFYFEETINEVATVFDLTGKVVFQETLNCSNIDLSSLSSGSYMLTIGDGVPQRIVIQ